MLAQNARKVKALKVGKHTIDITGFTDNQLAGQRLMVGFDGTDMNNDLGFLIGTLNVGGIILFSRNISSPHQLKNLCLAIQDYARTSGQPPLMIAVDQEGGQVARLKEPFTRFPGNPSMQGEEDAVHFAKVTAAELLKTGINMNMAPVMDVAPTNIQSVMVDRVFGHDPAWVSKLGVQVIKHLQANGVMAVAKHFPGIGRTTLDSHLDLPFLDADMEALQTSDLLPFKAAIENEVTGIMLSHIIYQQIDPEWPASLSHRIANVLLRDQMGFKGLVVTDDLDMGAIKKHYDIEIITRQILLSDIDMALICHKGPNIENAFEEIRAAIKDSQELRISGEQSVRRILQIKKEYLFPAS